MNAPAVTAPFLAATVVLGAAGLAKLWRPDDTARALLAAGAPLGRRAVRMGAAAELALAAAALAHPGTVTGSLVAASYLGFAAFVLAALQRGWPLATCGCFGRPDSRPTYLHAALDLGACGAAAWWASTAPSGLGRLFSQSPWHGAPLALLIAVIAALAYLIWTNPLAKVTS